MMTFTHPNNGFKVRISAPRFWTFLFGPLYFASHGVWSHAFISFVAAVFTAGLSWVVYPWLAPGILEEAYLRNGWRRKSGKPAGGVEVAPASTPV